MPRICEIEIESREAILKNKKFNIFVIVIIFNIYDVKAIK